MRGGACHLRRSAPLPPPPNLDSRGRLGTLSPAPVVYTLERRLCSFCSSGPSLCCALFCWAASALAAPWRPPAAPLSLSSTHLAAPPAPLMLPQCNINAGSTQDRTQWVDKGPGCPVVRGVGTGDARRQSQSTSAASAGALGTLLALIAGWLTGCRPAARTADTGQSGAGHDTNAARQALYGHPQLARLSLSAPEPTTASTR